MLMTQKIKKINDIAFCEPKTEKLHIYSKFQLPRIGSTLLATIMRDLGYQTHSYFLKKSDFLAMNVRTDLLCLSTITTTAPVAYQIADIYREKGIPVVIGGPHVTALPEEALEHCDFVIRGEGEIPLPALVDALNQGSPLSEVPSLSWKDEGVIRHNKLGPIIEDLDSLPFPDWSLLNTGGVKMNGVTLKPTLPFQTSRGCPFDCKFCSVTAMFGRKYRFRSVKSIIEELKQYNPHKYIIFFYDDNFSANKKRTKELLREMIAHEKEFGGRFQWSTQVRVDIAKDPELLDLMQQAGCVTLYIGFESINPDSLKEMKKGQSVEDIKRAIKEIHKRKIMIHGMFVFGFDHDTKDSLKATVKFAIRQKIGTAQFLILTPLPGTEFYYEMKNTNRWIDDYWQEFDTHHVKFVPKNFTLWELQKMQIWAHGRFYRLRNAFKKLFKGGLIEFLVGIYANRLNKRWQIWERKYLHKLHHLSAVKEKRESPPTAN